MQYQKLFILVVLSLVSIDSIESYSVNYHHEVQAKDSDDESIDFLSYNVWALPVWLPKVGINRRFDKIGNQLSNGHYEVICFQEAFMKRFRKKIFNRLGSTYYSQADYACSNTILGPIKRDCNGGLMTFSKYPILFESFIEFPIYEDMRVEEIIGHKGFLISLINGPNGKFYVINTHLYAGPSERDEFQRLRQIEFMKSIIDEEFQNNDYPLILMGDLNVDHPNTCKTRGIGNSPVYSYIKNIMGFIDTAPDIDENNFTIDKSRNKYSGSKNGKQKLDYCFYKSPEHTILNIVKFGTDFYGPQSYSDHLALYTTIHIEKERTNMNFTSVD
ncbi:MAG: hypothetical protein HKN09_05615 [Saprospiraceae bacterium]|nr:hypothetical protein [Saprospiraceae bacterium]